MKKKLLRYSLLLLALFVTFVFLFNARLITTDQDKQYIQAFLKEWNLTDSLPVARRDFDTEIRFISVLQDSMINGITHSFNPYNILGSVKYYYDTRKGFCYDRAALLEKTLRLAGFTTRHIFIYYDNGKPKLGFGDFFHKNSSHAMMEVKTVKGWMAIGSNSNWMGLKKDGTLLDIFQVRKCIIEDCLDLQKAGEVGVSFWKDVQHKGSFRIVYGLYSRHGQFLTSNPLEKWMNKAGIRSPFPDYNIRELFYNF